MAVKGKQDMRAWGSMKKLNILASVRIFTSYHLFDVKIHFVCLETAERGKEDSYGKTV
jgi:hypothetical protein